MRVTIIGTGVVGKATGGAFVLYGQDVMFYDTDPAAFEGIRLTGEDYQTTTDWLTAFKFGEVLVLCLPTPFDDYYKRCDISIVQAACQTIGKSLAEYPIADKVVIQKSTCPPGTAAYCHDLIHRNKGENPNPVRYLVCPEFLNAGTPEADALDPDRLIIGHGAKGPVYDNGEQWVFDVTADLFDWIDQRHFFYVSWQTAEFAKYASNAAHALLVSFWNEMELMGKAFREAYGAEVNMDMVAMITSRGRGLESVYRVFGMAWGGACLPKDTAALYHFSVVNGFRPPILGAVIDVNNYMAENFGVRSAHWKELHQEPGK